MSLSDLIPAPYNLIAKFGLPILALFGAYEVGSIHGYGAENTRLTAKYEPRLQHAVDVLNTSTARIQAARAQAKADDLAHTNSVLLQQQKVTHDVSASYQAQLADLRARYERMRGTPASTQAPGSGGGAAGLPATSSTASRPDGAACQDGLPPEDAFIASAQAIQLVKLQEWVRKQSNISEKSQ